MSKLLLRVYRENWSCIDPGEWFAMEWKIYKDRSVKLKIFYGYQYKETQYNLTEDIYKNIIKNIKLAKKLDKHVTAHDGDAWRFDLFRLGKNIWTRKLGYIYGIQPLEDIAYTLKNI